MDRNKKNRVPYIVKYVDFSHTRLSDHNNEFHEVVGIGEAKKIAQENNLDLVCFNEPQGNQLAFCRIINFGKWKYDEEKKKKGQQKKDNKHITKEIRFSPVISDNDIEHKIKRAKEFLDAGNEVVFSMKLKGRQKVHFKEAEERMNEIVEMCSDYGKVLSVKKSSSMITIKLGKTK